MLTLTLQAFETRRAFGPHEARDEAAAELFCGDPDNPATLSTVIPHRRTVQL
jgi:hypothetical protein